MSSRRHACFRARPPEAAESRFRPRTERVVGCGSSGGRNGSEAPEPDHPSPQTPNPARLVVCFDNRQQPTGTRRVQQVEHARARAGISDTPQGPHLQENRGRECPAVPASTAPEMSRRWSTVRVRQRALQKPRIRGFFLNADLQNPQCAAGMEPFMEPSGLPPLAMVRRWSPSRRPARGVEKSLHSTLRRHSSPTTTRIANRRGRVPGTLSPGAAVVVMPILANATAFGVASPR